MSPLPLRPASSPYSVSRPFTGTRVSCRPEPTYTIALLVLPRGKRSEDQSRSVGVEREVGLEEVGAASRARSVVEGMKTESRG